MPVLTTVTPNAGPPGTAITLAGSGFAASSRVACPEFVPTVYVSAASLTAAIPAKLTGAPGSSVAVSVFVENADLTRSATLPFTVQFPPLAQGYTTVDAVAAEIPRFKRGGEITDARIDAWIIESAHQVSAIMLSRGLSLASADWQQPDAAAVQPSPAAILEAINRAGAAAELASRVGAQFSSAQEWTLPAQLRRKFESQLSKLQSGVYDKLFRPGASTSVTGPQFAGGDIADDEGNAEQAFTKTQVF